MLNKYRRFLIIVIPVFIVLIILLNFARISGISSSLSPNILYLTQPVYMFSAIIQKIDGSTLLVSQEFNSTVPLPTNTQSTSSKTAAPTPGRVRITYKVVITDKTYISQVPTYVSYLLKQNTPPAAPVRLSVSDLQTGQAVTVNSVVDLRTFTGNQFEATSISLPPKMISVNGTITRINDKELIVRAPVPSTAPIMQLATSPVPTKELEYIITVDKDTEISRIMPSNNMATPPQPQKLALADLKKGMQVTIYTDVDVTKTTKLTALRVEPFIPIPAPSVIPSATPTTTPSEIPSALTPTAPYPQEP